MNLTKSQVAAIKGEVVKNVKTVLDERKAAIQKRLKKEVDACPVIKRLSEAEIAFDKKYGHKEYCGCADKRNASTKNDVIHKLLKKELGRDGDYLSSQTHEDIERDIILATISGTQTTQQLVKTLTEKYKLLV